MRLASSQVVMEWLNSGSKLSIKNFDPQMLQHVTYYIRVADRLDIFQRDGSWKSEVIDELKGYELSPNEYVRIWTLEEMSLSADVFVIFGPISDLIEQGLELIHSPFIDPLFRGRLRLGLRNVLPYPTLIRASQPIGKVSFFDVSDSHVQKPAPGSIMNRKLTTFQRYVELSDVSPFPPEGLDDEIVDDDRT